MSTKLASECVYFGLDPQRAKSNPSVAEYAGLSLQKSLSVDSERIPDQIPHQKFPNSFQAAQWDGESVDSVDEKV